MANIRKIRNRAATAVKIRALTRTMEMIATARFQRSHSLSAQGRPYTDRLTDLVSQVIAALGKKDSHPLLDQREQGRRETLLIITSNRGLCGSHNQNVLHTAIERYTQTSKAGYEISLHVVGKKGANYLAQKGYKVDKTYLDFDFLPEYNVVGKIAQDMMAQFIDHKIDGLEIAYTRVDRSGSHHPSIAQVLPLSEALAPARPASDVDEEAAGLDFYPSPQQILRNLLPAAVRLRLYQCFVDAAVTEQMARMTAMRSATDSADDMIENLTREHNRLRQGQITTQLNEIIGGQIALE